MDALTGLFAYYEPTPEPETAAMEASDSAPELEPAPPASLDTAHAPPAPMPAPAPAATAVRPIPEPDPAEPPDMPPWAEPEPL